MIANDYMLTTTQIGYPVRISYLSHKTHYINSYNQSCHSIAMGFAGEHLFYQWKPFAAIENRLR